MKKALLVSTAIILTLISCTQKAKNTETGTAPTTEQAVTENQYTDISLPGTQGQVVKVSDYVGKNKLVLIDFWASWCAPCRAEMPTVVKAYDLYHKKGLEIVGVSLDQNKDNWVNAIELLGQKWPQMSDLKGWNSKGAELYGIQSIPANVLINEKGEIVARDLRGEALLSTVGRYLGGADEVSN